MRNRKTAVYRNDSQLKIAMKPAGLTLRSGWFLFIGLIFLGVTSAASFEVIPNLDFGLDRHIAAFCSLILFFLIGLYLSFNALVLSCEKQEISIGKSFFTIRKSRILFGDTLVEFPLHSVSAVKLAEFKKRNYLNGYYSFYFNSTFAEYDYDGFLCPQVFLKDGNVYSFFEPLKKKEKALVMGEVRAAVPQLFAGDLIENHAD